MSAFRKGLWGVAIMSLLLPTFSAAATVELPKTGQTLCYDDVGTEIDCTGTGQDGEVQAGAAWPDPRFTDNGDGTITDNLTGLVWLKNGNCLGSPTWNDASSVAAALADGDVDCGLTDGSAPGDWRVPSVVDIRTLDNRGEGSPATWLAAQGFTNIRTGSDYWTDTVTTANSFGAWTFSANNGYLYNYKNRGNNFPLWAVRGGQVDGNPDPSYPANTWKTGRSGSVGVTWPSPRFTDNGDGSVTDNLTGLNWLQDAGCLPAATWSAAMAAAADLTSGTCGLTDESVAGDWRLPNYAELFSLIDFSRRLPTLPIGHPFTNVLETSSAYYWSSTSIFATAAKAIDLRFDGEIASGNKDAATYHSLPVRNFAAAVPPAPEITVSPTTHNFTITSVGSQEDITVTVSNVGTADLTLEEAATVNPLDPPFSIVSDNCSSTILVPAEECQIVVRFAPTSTGELSDSFDIVSDDADEGSVTVWVSGIITVGAAPDIAISETTVAFGQVTEGTSADHVLTVSNNGNADLNVGEIAAINPLAAPFSIAADSCSGQPLAPTETCTVTVQFAPTAVESGSDTFDVPSDDPDTPTFTVTVNGTGTAVPVPDIAITDTLAPDSDLQMSFPDVTVGASSTTETVTVTNSGSAELNVSAIALGGSDAGEFALDANGGGSPCGDIARILDASESCTVTLTFSPTAAGQKTATLEIASDDPDEGTVTVNLSGNGLAVGPGGNNPPSDFQLLSPANGQSVAINGLFGPLHLRWKPATDPDGDPVSYQVYYCTDTDPFNNCSSTQVAHLPPAGPGLPDSGRDVSQYGLLAACLGGGLLTTLLIMMAGCGDRRWRIALCVLPLTAAGLLLGSCGSDGDGLSLRPENLEANTTYYWGVVAEDDRGGATESEVWHFTTR